MFRVKYALLPRARFLFCCMCTEDRLLNFATINMIFSTIMIVVGIWDTVTDLTSQNGRWHEHVWYGIMDVVSILLAAETLVIHFKYP